MPIEINYEDADFPKTIFRKVYKWIGQAACGDDTVPEIPCEVVKTFLKHLEPGSVQKSNLRINCSRVNFCQFFVRSGHFP